MAQTDRNGSSTEAGTAPSRFTWRGAWVTTTLYVRNDVFRYDGASYITLVDHTAGVFSTDLAADLLELFADKGLAGAGSGDMLGGNNLAEVTDAGVSRANIVAAKSGANTDITSLGDIGVGTITAAEGIVFKEGAAVASTTTTEVWASDGNTRHVTGNNPISSFGTAPQAGATMRIIFDGTPLITDSANLVLNAGGDDIQIEAGDWMDLYADTTTALRGVVHRASGAPIAGGITSGTAIATTSGTSHDFTGIPSTVKRITVMFAGVSTNGTSVPIIRLGDSGGVENTGYTQLAAQGTSAFNSGTTGFAIQSSYVSTTAIYGVYTFVLLDSATFTWCGTGTFNENSVPRSVTCSGGKALTATLTQIRLTTVNGTDAFDAGSVSILYD